MTGPPDKESEEILQLPGSDALLVPLQEGR